MTPKPLFTAEQIAAFNAAARALESKMLAARDGIEAAFGPAAEAMSAVVRSMQEKS